MPNSAAPIWNSVRATFTPSKNVQPIVQSSDSLLAENTNRGTLKDRIRGRSGSNPQAVPRIEVQIATTSAEEVQIIHARQPAEPWREVSSIVESSTSPRLKIQIDTTLAQEVEIVEGVTPEDAEYWRDVSAVVEPLNQNTKKDKTRWFN